MDIKKRQEAPSWNLKHPTGNGIKDESQSNKRHHMVKQETWTIKSKAMLCLIVTGNINPKPKGDEIVGPLPT